MFDMCFFSTWQSAQHFMNLFVDLALVPFRAWQGMPNKTYFQASFTTERSVECGKG